MVLLNKMTTIIILLLLLFMASYPVIAKDATTGAARKEKARETIEVRKEKVAERMENKKEVMASREAALKAKLERFKDKRKAEVTDKVNTNLNRINQKQTKQMIKHLDKMSTILGKLEERVNKGTSDIKDVTAAKAAIASAKEGIATATASVKLQAEKDYTIAVSSESTVRKDAKKIREQLHNDLKTVRKQVVDAKQAVSNAIRVAKSGKLEIPKKEGTSSGRE